MRTKAGRIVLLAVCLAVLASPAPPTSADSDVLRAKLKNGLRVVIVRNGIAPVVTTEINYLVGSNEAPEAFPGTAHALEHMMFRGSQGLPADQLAAIVASLGGDFNAATQQTVTQYYFTVPADALDIALRIEAIRMQDVLSTEELWMRERGAIEQEVAQTISSPDYVAFTMLLQKMFPGTPYAVDALGTRPSFQKTTGQMVREFHKTWYAPNNAILVIVGDVDPEEALEEVRRRFEPIPSRPVPPRAGVRLKDPVPGTIALETDLPYGAAMVAWRMPGYDSPDFAAGQLLGDVLSSPRGALYSLVTEGKALSVEFDGHALPKAALGYASATFPRGADGAALVTEIRRIIAAAVKSGFPPDLVEAAKRREIAAAEFEKNSVAGLAESWSQALAVEGRESPDDAIEAIRKVTAEDVSRVARKCLDDARAVVAVLTPKSAGRPVTAKGPRGGESFAPRSVKPVSLPAWARRVEAVPPVPESRVSPIVTVLPNGLRLIVQRETISRTVSLYGRIRSKPAIQEPPGKEGVEEILDRLFPYGTEDLDRLAFQAALDEIGAEASAGTSFSLHVLPDRFERGLGLLAENLLAPALPEEALKVIRQSLADAARGEIESPGYLVRRTLLEALYPPGDPARREALPSTIASVTQADVRNYHARVFRPDMTTVVVIGDIHPDRVKAAVETRFGAWKARGPKPDTDLPPAPANGPSASVVPDAGRVQDQVILAETIGITRQHPDYYPLQVGNGILSGAFYATRLERDLREQAGLVYSVDSFLDAGKTRSVFGVEYACDSPNVAKARALVVRNLRELRDRPVAPAELRQAKTLLIRQIPLSESSVSDIAQGLIERVEADLPLDEPVRAARRYREMTADEVRDAFARWIRPDDFAQVVRGPPPK